jgi:hypothetical protein
MEREKVTGDRDSDRDSDWNWDNAMEEKTFATSQ